MRDFIGICGYPACVWYTSVCVCTHFLYFCLISVTSLVIRKTVKWHDFKAADINKTRAEEESSSVCEYKMEIPLGTARHSCVWLKPSGYRRKNKKKTEMG